MTICQIEECDKLAVNTSKELQMTISQVEDGDEPRVNTNKALHKKLGVQRHNQDPTKMQSAADREPTPLIVPVKKSILWMRVEKFFSHALHLYRYSWLGVTLRRASRGLTKMAYASVGRGRVTRPFIPPPTKQDMAENAYRQFGFYTDEKMKQSTYYSLTQKLELANESSFKQSFYALGHFVWQYSLGALWDSGLALAREVSNNFHGIWVDWQEGYTSQTSKPRTKPLLNLWHQLNQLKQDEKKSFDEKQPQPQAARKTVPMAAMAPSCDTGQLDNDPLNFISNQAARILADLTEVQAKYPMIGTFLSVTIGFSASSLILQKEQLAYVEKLCKTFNVPLPKHYPLTNMIDTAYTNGICMHEALAILSGSENSWLRNLSIDAIENLPTLLASIGAFVAAGKVFPQTMHDVIDKTRVLWSGIKNCEDWMPQVVMYAVIMSMYTELRDQAVYPDVLRKRMRGNEPAATFVLLKHLFPNENTVSKHAQFLSDVEYQQVTQMLLSDLLMRSPQLLAVLPYQQKRMILRIAKQVLPNQSAFLRQLDNTLFREKPLNFLANAIFMTLSLPIKLLRLLFSFGQGDSLRQCRNYAVINLSRVASAVINPTDALFQYARYSLRAAYDFLSNQLVGRAAYRVGMQYNRLNAKLFNGLDVAWSRLRFNLQRLPNAIRSKVATRSTVDTFANLSYREIQERMQLPQQKVALIAASNRPQSPPPSPRKEKRRSRSNSLSSCAEENSDVEMPFNESNVSTPSPTQNMNNEWLIRVVRSKEVKTDSTPVSPPHSCSQVTKGAQKPVRYRY